ncbi:cytidylate kinase-like family protein [Patescibacteria group bacterium]|nr:cytidylate kinase-like family protein [Patescibacteria group bacterium]
MAVITISRGSFSHGKEIAENVAERLGYDCISREILLEASKDFNIPELKLFHAIHDSPSFLDNMFFRKEKYIAYIQAAVLKSLKKDNVVYHGFAGHFFVQNVAHVLKVRIIASMAERVRGVMKRNKFSRDEAVKYIHKVDEQRRKWSQQLYGIETAEPSLYDMVINIGQLTLEDAVDIICHKVSLKRFRKTPESQQRIEDLSLAAIAKAAIVERFPSSQASCQNAVVLVRIETALSLEEKVTAEIKEILKGIDEIKEVRVSVVPFET